LTFLSAAFMPLNLAPDWLRTIAAYNPVNWAVEAGRAALVSPDPDWSFILPRLTGLAGLALMTTAWATWTFRTYQRSI
jgi:ABC-2 type transport system permease protein